MKLLSAAALALLAIAPTVASATAFSLNFEKNWDYGTEVRNYYNGGTASDGTSGPNVGVQFINVSALSNDALGPYYANAPTPLGTIYAFTPFGTNDHSFLNVLSGVSNALSFYYASPIAITGAIQAWSGINGTGTLLGSIDLPANAANYDLFSLGTLRFASVARSFDLTGIANGNALLDNIATVPEPSTVLMLLAGATGLVTLRGRRKNG